MNACPSSILIRLSVWACLLVISFTLITPASAQTPPVRHLYTVTTETAGLGAHGRGDLGYSVDISGSVLVAGAPTYWEAYYSAGETFGPAGGVFAFQAGNGNYISHAAYGTVAGIFQPLGRTVAVHGRRAIGSRVTDCCTHPTSLPTISWSIDDPTQVVSYPQQLDIEGDSVAIRDNLIAIGSINDNRFIEPWYSQSGVVRLYTADDAIEAGVLGASDPLPGRGFGEAVAITDDFILVGSLTGGVYVFDRHTLTQQRQLRPTPASLWFGRKIDADGDLFIASGLSNFVGSGTAWIYNARTGQQLMQLSHADAAPNDEFAQWGVALSWPYAAVTCRRCFTEFQYDGAVYVFDVRNGQQIARLVSPQPSQAGWFGTSVAMEGDLIAVGEVPYADIGNPSQGSVHVFRIGDRIFADAFE